jgi:ComF family protein
MASLLKNILHFLLPNHCIFCKRAARPELALCGLCETRYAAYPLHCEYCGLASLGAPCCGKCQIKRPNFSRLIAGSIYEFPFDYCVKQLKFQQQFLMADVLAYLLAKKILQKETPLPNFMVPVPLHLLRLRERGFNQAELIALRLKKYLPIQVLKNACYKINHTLPQSGLPAKKREKNIRHAFASSRRFDALHLAIVDDVVTTGSTVTELTSLLLENGAKQVDVWTAARAMQH